MIKVTLGEVKTQEEKPFPKLMISKNTGRLVFFLSKYDGLQMNTVTHPDTSEEYRSPHYSSSWVSSEFTDYNEPITLQNA